MPKKDYSAKNACNQIYNTYMWKSHNKTDNIICSATEVTIVYDMLKHKLSVKQSAYKQHST